VQDVALWMLSSEAQAIWFEETNFLPVRRSLAETWLENQDLRASRQALLALTLAATEQENWSTWLPVTDEPECRAALVRALFDLNTDQPVADVLSSAQAACEQVNGEQP
jgi:ABC-type glycerol-3-phosphate transport system substrate-binding protein